MTITERDRSTYIHSEELEVEESGGTVAVLEAAASFSTGGLSHLVKHQASTSSTSIQLLPIDVKCQNAS